MPSSDNLYSLDDDSDGGESFSNELSPTDGFFHRSEIPANTIVEDPSIDSKAEAKVLIPAPHSQSSTGRTSGLSSRSGPSQSIPPHPYASIRAGNTSSSPVTSYNPVSPTSPQQREGSVTEHTPLLRDPPPAYSASPEERMSPIQVSTETQPESQPQPQPQTHSVYNTFPEHHLERGFRPQREPESMGPPVERPDESTPLTSDNFEGNRPSRRPGYIYRGNLIKNLLLAALLLSVMISILTAMLSGTKSVGD